jgi:hypothetical protein
MCHSIRVHKVIYSHPLSVVTYIHLPYGYDILKPIIPSEMLSSIYALADYLP